MTKPWLGHFILGGLGFMLAAPTWADYQAGVDAYERGEYETAMKEWRPLAEQGDASAQSNLGQMYRMGHGVPQDYQEAVHWYRLAAEQGLLPAHSHRGFMYSKGKGVAQDYQEAIRWYRLAAEQGSALAQYNLGVMYNNGEGLPKDYVLAHMWANLAAAQGNENAIKARDFLEKRMTPAQLAEAQRLAREWKPKGE